MTNGFTNDNEFTESIASNRLELIEEAKLVWDFFGRSAAPTAEHFKRHLEEFLEKNAIQAKEVTLCSEDTLHMGVRCFFEPTTQGHENATRVAKVLKPGRRSQFYLTAP
jgi:hypothetical protein